MADSPLLTKKEAAAFCRCSIAAFDAHVRPIVPCKRIGRRVLFNRADLEVWAQAEAKPEPAPKSLGAPSLRQPWTGGSFLQQLLASPECVAFRAQTAAKNARRATRDAKKAEQS